MSTNAITTAQAETETEIIPAGQLTRGTAEGLEELARTLELSARFAKAICNASVLPEHLRTRRINGKITDLTKQEVEANCLLICNQAIRWGVDPMALLGESYIVGGKLSFQGKLVAAIINRELSMRLEPSYEGSENKPMSLEAIITGQIRGEDRPKTVEISFAKAHTKDESGKPTSQWTDDPKQKLFYSGCIRWARRHLPEVLMGVDVVDNSEDRTEGLLESETPGASRCEVYFDRVEKALHRGHIDQIILDCMADGKLTPQDRESIKAHARRPYKGLPTAEAFHDPTEEAEAQAAQFDEKGRPTARKVDKYLHDIATATRIEQVRDAEAKAAADPNVSGEQLEEVLQAANEAKRVSEGSKVAK